MHYPQIVPEQLMKKRQEIFSLKASSTANFKRAEWIRSFNGAIAFGNIGAYQRLFEERANDPELMAIDPIKNYRETFRQSILHTMCINDRVPMLEYLLQRKVGDIHQLDDQGRPPFHVAVVQSLGSSRIQALRVLLNAGANILMKDILGKTAYDYCLEVDPEEVMVATQFVGEEYNKKHNKQLRQLLFTIMHTEGRFKQPFCYLTDNDIYRVMELL